MKALVVLNALLALHSSPQQRADRVRLRFVAEPGLEMLSVHEQKVQVELEQFEMRVNEATIDPMLLPEVKASIRMYQEIVFEDTYREQDPDDGHVPRGPDLERRFAKILREVVYRTQIDGEPAEKRVTQASLLEGSTVHLPSGQTDRAREQAVVPGPEQGPGQRSDPRTIPRESRHVAADPEREAQDVLASLRRDPFWSGFLPSQEVSVGERWSIPARVFEHCFSPGGDLGLGDAPSGDPRRYDPIAPLRDALDGTASACFHGLRGVEGLSLAAIEIESKLRGGSRLPPAAEIPEGRIELETELGGELLWNVSTNTPHSFQLSGVLRLRNESIEEDPDAGRIVSSSVFRGGLSLEVRFAGPAERR